MDLLTPWKNQGKYIFNEKAQSPILPDIIAWIPMNIKKYPSQEYALLKGLEPYLNFTKSARYPIGIGDDAAIRNSRGKEALVFTADAMVENVHFSLAYMTFAELGFKAMCINLSDCAAMGARPDGALAQIVFPQSLRGREVSKAMRAIYSGFRKACAAWNFPIIGGNLSKWSLLDNRYYHDRPHGKKR